MKENRRYWSASVQVSAKTGRKLWEVSGIFGPCSEEAISDVCSWLLGVEAATALLAANMGVKDEPGLYECVSLLAKGEATVEMSGYHEVEEVAPVLGDPSRFLALLAAGSAKAWA